MHFFMNFLMMQIVISTNEHEEKRVGRSPQVT